MLSISLRSAAASRSTILGNGRRSIHSTALRSSSLGQIASARAKDVENQWIDLHDPATQTILTKVPKSTSAEFDAAVTSSEKAFPAWRETSLLGRQAVMLKLQALIRHHMDDIANSITLEQGKTFGDAKGDVLRGLQVVETACGITSTMMEDRMEVAKEMDTYVRKEPLGVTASIAPFNFPAMIPLWTIPMATVTGNTLILKPSERDPGASMIIAELCERAGMPKGVVNVVNGAVDTVNAICDDPRIKAITLLVQIKQVHISITEVPQTANVLLQPWCQKSCNSHARC
ncbi:hypothetical protein L7F22_038870 [Adiantum nelumboides]|nr:hypothetical protein [Adiantum nelumboides]